MNTLQKLISKNKFQNQMRVNAILTIMFIFAMILVGLGKN